MGVTTSSTESCQYSGTARDKANFLPQTAIAFRFDNASPTSRRYKNEVSEQIITRHLHDGRQAVRRLGKVMAGDRDSIRCEDVPMIYSSTSFQHARCVFDGQNLASRAAAR